MKTISICFVLKLQLSKGRSHWNRVKNGKEDSSSLRFLPVTPVDSLTPRKSSSDTPPFLVQVTSIYISLPLGIFWTLLRVSKLQSIQIFRLYKQNTIFFLHFTYCVISWNDFASTIGLIKLHLDCAVLWRNEWSVVWRCSSGYYTIERNWVRIKNLDL